MAGTHDRPPARTPQQQLVEIQTELERARENSRIYEAILTEYAVLEGERSKLLILRTKVEEKRIEIEGMVSLFFSC